MKEDKIKQVPEASAEEWRVSWRERLTVWRNWAERALCVSGTHSDGELRGLLDTRLAKMIGAQTEELMKLTFGDSTLGEIKQVTDDVIANIVAMGRNPDKEMDQPDRIIRDLVEYIIRTNNAT